MPDRLTISNTSCLIGLEYIGRLEILHQLYGAVTIPEAVAAEWRSPLPAWMSVLAVLDRGLVRSLRNELGAGEAEAIALAVEQPVERLILDDKKARRLALELRLPITGTVGVILRAKERSLIPSLRPLLEELRARGFQISDPLLTEARRLANE